MKPPNAPNCEGAKDVTGSGAQRDQVDFDVHPEEADRTVERIRGEFPDFFSLPQ